MAGVEKFTLDQVKRALWATGGVLMDTAIKLDTSTKVLYGYFRRHPELWEEKHLVEEMNLDFSESQLLRKIKAGNLRAITFYLETKGKHRGYHRKIELEEKPPVDNTPIKGEVNYKKLPTEVLKQLVEHIEKHKEEDTEEEA